MPKRILVVEDHEDTRLFMKMYLEDMGYDYIEAEDGHIAVRKAFEESPDLILMDLALPNLNGISAVRKIRAVPKLQNIPIICVTAYEDHYREEVNKVGCYDILTKPVAYEKLERLIDEIFRETEQL